MVVDAVVEGQTVDVLPDQVVVGVAQSGELGVHQSQRAGDDAGPEQLYRPVRDARRHGAAAEVPVYDRLLYPCRNEL